MRLAISLVTAAATLAAAAGAFTAPATAKPGWSCKARSVFLAVEDVRILQRTVRSSAGFEEDRRYVCSSRFRRPKLIERGGTGGHFPEVYDQAHRAGGYLAALAQGQSDGGFSERLVVVDLTRGLLRGADVPTSSEDRVIETAVSPAGRVALAARRHLNGEIDIFRYRLGRTRISRARRVVSLARTAALEPGSLRIEGDRVSWRMAGTTQSAPTPAATGRPPAVPTATRRECETAEQLVSPLSAPQVTTSLFAFGIPQRRLVRIPAGTAHRAGIYECGSERRRHLDPSPAEVVAASRDLAEGELGHGAALAFGPSDGHPGGRVVSFLTGRASDVALGPDGRPRRILALAATRQTDAVAVLWADADGRRAQLVLLPAVDGGLGAPQVVVEQADMVVPASLTSDQDRITWQSAGEERSAG